MEVADAAVRAAASLASNACKLAGSVVRRRAIAACENTGASNGCSWNAAETWAATSSGLTGWLNRSTITGGLS